MFHKSRHKFLPRRPGHTAVVGYVALFLALGGGALAATGAFTGSDGRIHGCVNAKGALTVLRAPATNCTAGKARIAWNQTGPRGIKGQRGPQGIQGIQGIQGAQGLQGPKGDGGPGAISIPITHLDHNTTAPARVLDGIQINVLCGGSMVVVSIQNDAPGGTIYASGEKAEDGALTAVNTSSTSTIGALGAATANLDVIATARGTWDRIDLGGFDGGASGCNFWGLLIPGT
jgi:hypothetical protein